MENLIYHSENRSQVDLAHVNFEVYTLPDMATIFRVSLSAIYNWMVSDKSSSVVVCEAYIPEEQLKDCLANHQVELLKRKEN